MPLSSADLLYDTGEIRAEWLEAPGIVPADSLDKWLAQGYAEASAAGVSDASDRDGIARAYAYWRAYQSIARRIAATPSSVNLQGDLSVSFSDKRYLFFENEAERWRAEFEAAKAGAVAEVTGAASVPQAGRTLENVVRL